MAVNRKKDFQKCRTVFVYGTLKQGYWNNPILENSKLISKDAYTVDKFLLFNVGFPYAILNKNGNIIKGELYTIENLEVFENLDKLEGYPNFYDRKILTINYIVNDIVFSKQAWMYVYDKPEGNEVTEVKYNNILNKYYKEWR